MIQPAIDFVIATLEKIRETSDCAPRASRNSLAQLQSAYSVLLPCGKNTYRLQGNSYRKLDRIRRGFSPLFANAFASAQRCAHLASSRTQTVFGVGNPDAEIMFIGEAPARTRISRANHSSAGAGQLLTKIIKAMGFARDDVYIANILKCRPDMPAGSFGNRRTDAGRDATCRPYLVEQIDIIQPKVLVALGAVAVEGLLGARGTMRELRGRWHSYNGTPLMITYHPAYLLRNQSPSEKRKVWEDMMQVLERLEKPISEKQRNYFL
jgi:DNA polymerase